MLRCIKCGSPIEGLAQYCSNCATPAPSTAGAGPAVATAPACPRCGSPLPEEGAFCPFCSANLQVQYAGFWMRLVAYIVDGIILNVIGFIVGLVVTSIAMSILIGLAIGIAYFVGFWTMEGATPGKMIMGIRIVKTNGEPLDLGTAFVRYLGYIVSGLTLGIGFLMIAFSGEKRGLHDNIAGTVVIHGGR